MRFEVLLTHDAARDLEEIHEYVAEHDAPARADHVLDRIEAVIAGLATLPERGSHPRELLAVGIREYREVRFKPYRVIYRPGRRRSARRRLERALGDQNLVPGLGAAHRAPAAAVGPARVCAAAGPGESGGPGGEGGPAVATAEPNAAVKLERVLRAIGLNGLARSD